MNMRRISVIVLMLLFSIFASAERFPNGAHASVRVGQSLNSGTAHKGEAWEGTLTRNNRVRGTVSYVKRSGRLHDPGQISIRLASINGDPVYSSRVSRKGKSHTKSN